MQGVDLSWEVHVPDQSVSPAPSPALTVGEQEHERLAVRRLSEGDLLELRSFRG